MNGNVRLFLVLTLLLGGAAVVVASQAAPGFSGPTQAGSPEVVAYQGEVRVDGEPHTGTGYFKFAVVDASGDTTYWSNDGTSTTGGEPTASVPLSLSDGLFSVLLGDASEVGMTQPLTAGVFSDPGRYLRVWFSTSGGSGTFDPLAEDTRIAAVPYALQAQEAVNADTVDGLHADELGAHYQNVVIVAHSGGDHSSVQAAIDGITDAAADNAYLVWVAPGVYSETVTMKPHVHLQGAGQGATVITSTASSSAWPPSQATLALARDTSLRDLTVGSGGDGDENVALMATAGATRTLVADVTARAQGGGLHNYAIFLNGSGTQVALQQINALAQNGNSLNYGLHNYGGASATLRGGSFTGQGGADAWGIYNEGGGTNLQAESVAALGENGFANNHGLHNSVGATATLRSGSFTGRGGSGTRGIFNDGSSTTLEAESVTALGENGINNSFGLHNSVGATATLRGGSFTARGGADARGIQNWAVPSGAVATLEAEGVTILSESGSVNYGLSNYTATANVTQSVLEGATYSVFRTGGTVTVSNSRLVDGPVEGIVTCVLVTRGTDISTDGSTCP